VPDGARQLFHGTVEHESRRFLFVFASSDNFCKHGGAVSPGRTADRAQVQTAQLSSIGLNAENLGQNEATKRTSISSLTNSRKKYKQLIKEYSTL